MFRSVRRGPVFALVGALACAGSCAGPDDEDAFRVRFETRALPEAAPLKVLGHTVQLARTVRSGLHFPPRELEELTRRESVVVECPSVAGVKAVPAVLWFPRRGRDDLRERFAVVSVSRTAVDPHYPLVWTAAGALVLEMSPCELRPEVAAAAARYLAERFALSADRLGLEVHAGPWEDAPQCGPLRSGGSYPFGFGLQLGGEDEIEFLLSAGVPAHRALPEGEPARDMDAAFALHRPRLEFVDEILGRWDGKIDHVVDGVVAGRRVRVQLRARPNEVEAMARRALDDGDRAFAETGSVGATLDAMRRRLDGFGLDHALVAMGAVAVAALGPPANEPAFAVPLPLPTPLGGLTPAEFLRDGAMMVEGGAFDPLPATRFVCVFAPSARQAESLARRCRELDSESEIAALFEARDGVHVWMLLGDASGMRWRRVPETPDGS